MKRVAISEIAEVNPRLPVSFRADEGRRVSFVAMADVSEGGFVATYRERRLQDVVKGYTYFGRGDVLSAKITPCMQNGKAAVTDPMPHEIGFGSTEFHVLRPGPEITGRYLFHMIWSPYYRRSAERSFTGTAGQQRVPTDFFERFKIPLPPLTEQNRIAGILDKANALRQKRQQALQLTEQFLRSTFLDMFGDPVTNPNGWPVRRLEEIAVVSRGKFTPRPRNDPRYYGGAYPFIQTGDLSNCTGVLRVWKQTLNDEGIAVSKMFPKGTIAIAIAANIGDTAILGFDAYATDSVVGIQVHADKAVAEYIEFWLRFQQQSLRDRAPETAQKNINLEILRPLATPAPPVELQRRFGSVVGRLDQLGQRHEASSRAADCLFHSLVQRAFRGEL